MITTPNSMQLNALHGRLRRHDLRLGTHVQERFRCVEEIQVQCPARAAELARIPRTRETALAVCQIRAWGCAFVAIHCRTSQRGPES